MFRWLTDWLWYIVCSVNPNPERNQTSLDIDDLSDFDRQMEEAIANELHDMEVELAEAGAELEAELDEYDGEDMFGEAHYVGLPLGLDSLFDDYPDEVSMEFEYPNYTYRARLIKVVDADTFDVLIDLGLHTSVRKRLRLLDIDAWETRGEEREMGLIASARAVELTNLAEMMVQTKMDTTGKYGRLLAIVWVRKEGEKEFTNVNATLVEEGHATVYD